MIVEAKELAVRKLADARAECRVSQEKLAREARVSKPVVVRAENGFTVTRISAHAILKALNKFREDAGLEPIDFYDLDWKLQGEET